MPGAIYLNLPVADLPRSMTFFEGLGFTFNRQFTGEDAAALVISDSIYVMLHTHESLRRFTKKEIADATRVTEVLTALQLESRERVDELMDRVLAAGGREYREREDHGFMFTRTFEDPDGHIWELFWMDPSRVE
jgi:uncharacterized protein